MDKDIVFDPEDMGYYPQRPRWLKKKQAVVETAGGDNDHKGKHIPKKCEACKFGKGCGFKKDVKRGKKNRKKKTKQSQQQQKQQQQKPMIKAK